MSIRRRLIDDERGLSMLVVLMLTSVLSLTSVALYDVVHSEAGQSTDAVQRQSAYAAAEAGISSYIDKLVEDPVYYSHYVSPGEATRQASGGPLVGANTAWSGSLVWSYPNGKDAWVSLGNGYEYDLQITAPSASANYVQIVSTGRKAGTASKWRVIQVYTRSSTIADFQMLADEDIQYGSAATTNGLIYAGIDSSGVAHGVGHSGSASKNIYAEGCIGTTISFATHTCSGSGPTLSNGATLYSSATIRTQIKTPINFSSFLTSLTDIQRAAQAGGVYLDNTAISAWKLVFSSGGTFTAQQCTASGGSNVASVAPTCGAATTYNIPSNGAVYSPQTVIVSGTVKGRVTVASNNDIVVADNLTTNDGHCTNQSLTATDIIGLDAAQNVYVATYVPTNLTWCAGTIAQGGVWASYINDGSHGTMTFIGSTATENGGSMSLFTTRVYNYDSALAYLQPPWFPTVGQSFTITLFRELPAP